MQLVRDWLDPTVSNEAIAASAPRFMESSGEFDAVRTRALKLLRGIRYDPSHILSYPFKPFDVRLAYLDPMIQPLFSRPAPALMRQACTPDNFFFLTRDTADKDPEGAPFFVSKRVCDYDFLSGHARHFSCLSKTSERRGFHDDDVGDLGFTNGRLEEQTTANLSAYARSYLASLGISDVDGDVETAGLVWMHALAIGYSHAYLTENADGIRQSWPRIPLPATREVLESSAALGKSIAALLDTESSVDAVNVGTVRRELRCMGTLQVSPGHVLDTVAGDLGITAGWGHGGKDGVTMPGKGRLTKRDYSAPELEAIEAGAVATGMTLDDALTLLGRQTYDVWLNDVAFWQNVPVNAWNYIIGGYQVIKKWLSYRERTLLDRDLSIDETRYVTEMVRRLAALVLLQPSLDANYRACAAAVVEREQTAGEQGAHRRSRT